MEAVFPTGTLPVSAVATTSRPTIQARPRASHRLVDHALSVVAADMGIGLDRVPSSVASTNPVVSYNPVVIVGPTGSGKSRLLAEWFVQHSHADETKRPAVVMWDGRSLVRELTAALSQNAIDRLHTRFVSSRLIIIDSVEQMTAWDAQRALAHLFDAAIAAGSVFVATLRMHPMACPGLEPSLASRLSGGLVVAMPPVETTRYHSDGDGAQTQPGPSLRRVIGATSRRHGLTAADLVGPSRCRQVSLARGMAMYIARRLTTRSLQSIGAAFGGRDHTTVLHGIRVTETRRARDPGIAADIDQLIEMLLRR
jgi:chromosomal replication initiation ATPase DnaA